VAYAVEDGAVDDDGGRRHHTQRNGLEKNAAAVLAVVFVGIDPHPVADPDLLGVADLESGLIQRLQLTLEFSTDTLATLLLDE